MPTHNEAIAVLNNCNFNPTLNAYYLAEIQNRKDSPQDLETIIGAMKLSAKARENANEIKELLAKNHAQISNLQQAASVDAKELKNRQQVKS